MKTLWTIILSGTAIAALSGCQIMWDKKLDCIDSDGPLFDKQSLLPAVANQRYEETVSVSLNNEPYDNRYKYEFLVRGELPPGITSIQHADNRELFIDGTPTESGVFDFKIYVSVSAPNRTLSRGGLCRYTHSREFTLEVNPETR